jgi:hypothetical protein
MALVTTPFLQATFAPIFDLIDAAGEDVIIREHVGQSQPLVDHTVIRGKAQPFRSEDIMDGSTVKQGDFKVICRASSFPVARKLEQKDRVRLRGHDYSVINDDSNQYAIGGVVYARVLHLRG